MKVIKLDRRYKPNKEAGYEAGLRFNGYWDDWNAINQIEQICKSRLNSGWSALNSDWLGYFGKRRSGVSAPCLTAKCDSPQAGFAAWSPWGWNSLIQNRSNWTT